jgi:hypothetical protein
LAVPVVRQLAYWNWPPEARLRASPRASLLALEPQRVRQSHMALIVFSGSGSRRAIPMPPIEIEALLLEMSGFW